MALRPRRYGNTNRGCSGARRAVASRIAYSLLEHPAVVVWCAALGTREIYFSREGTTLKRRFSLLRVGRRGEGRGEEPSSTAGSLTFESVSRSVGPLLAYRIYRASRFARIETDICNDGVAPRNVSAYRASLSASNAITFCHESDESLVRLASQKAIPLERS